MAAAYCYEGIPLRFLASLFDIQMRILVTSIYEISMHGGHPNAIRNLARVQNTVFGQQQFLIAKQYFVSLP